MTEAPHSPTTAELRANHGIGLEAELAVLRQSEAISSQLTDHYAGLLAIVGSCAMGSDRLAIMAESSRIAEFGDEYGDDSGLQVLHRIPPWKPRTNPNAWHGEETTNPTGAYQTLASLAIENANAAIEVASVAHIDRYAPMLSFGWLGSRKVDDEDLGRMVAIRDPKLPLGVKNGLDGSIESALDRVGQIDELRKSVDKQAPAILIYRGGENARTPEKWEQAYRQVLAVTEGRLIVDVAHGSEMAHDPNGNFDKTVAGQILAIEAVLRVAEQGEFPAGIMIEASDLETDEPERRTDPNIPLQTALEGISQLYSLKFDTVGEASEITSLSTVAA